MNSVHDIDEVGLTATTPTFVGDDVMLDVQSMMSTNPPRILLAVDPPGEDRPTQRHVLSLGDTFPVEDETWRFEDVTYRDADHWVVIVRRVEPGSPPFEPPPLVGNRVWIEVEMRPFGTADEPLITDLERDLGRRLPPAYREWLAENNGAVPAQDAEIRGGNVGLTRHHPLLGILPDLPYADLRQGETLRKEYLTDYYVVIGRPLGGLLAVGIRPAHLDEIFHLPREAITNAHLYRHYGYPTRQEYLTTERLVPVAPDIYSFCAYLYPMPPTQPAFPATEPANGPVSEPASRPATGEAGPSA